MNKESIINELTGLAYRISKGEVPQSTSLEFGAAQQILEIVRRLKSNENENESNYHHG